MATIKQRGDRWQCRIRRNGFADVAKSFATKEDAQKWARGIERQMDIGEYSPVGLDTLNDLIKRYLKEVTPHKKGAKQEGYRLNGIKTDRIANLNLKDLSPLEVAAYRDRRLKDCKPVTVLHDLCVLSAVIEHARLEWSVPITNPVRGIRKPSAGKGRDRRLEAGEYDNLLVELHKARTPWIAPLFVFSIETACRMGEALALQWADVDLHRKIATFRDTKVGENRTIPLSPLAVQTLTVLPRDLQGKVFCISKHGVDDAFRRACKRAGIEGLRWHDLRHEGVSRLHEKGLSTVEVASISGHRTLACLARYSHMKAETLARKLG